MNIVTVAILSTPLFRWFGDARLNTFITCVPFVWLPGVLVPAALMGDILVWRKLRLSAEESRLPRDERAAARS